VPNNRQEVFMQVPCTRCAGLDVHKDTIVACVRCVSPPMHQEVRSFRTTTTELLKLADWLAGHDCTHVAMEATGVYWKPVWHLLEAEFDLVLADAARIRKAPGRKTVSEAMWITSTSTAAATAMRSSRWPTWRSAWRATRTA